MHLHVNSNLALELPPDTVASPAPKKKIDPRAELASQFIPAGARVLDLSGSAAMQRLLPDSCSYHGIDRASKKRTTPVCDLNSGDFPTEAASQCDVIVMLGALERIADVESLFTHLRFDRHWAATLRIDYFDDVGGGRLAATSVDARTGSRYGAYVASL